MLRQSKPGFETLVIINIYTFTLIMHGISCSILTGSCSHGDKDDQTSHFRDFRFEDVCRKNRTLLWDLVQDENAVSCKMQTPHPLRVFGLFPSLHIRIQSLSLIQSKETLEE